MSCELLDVAKAELKDNKLKCGKECEDGVCPISKMPPFKVTFPQSSRPVLNSPPHVLANIDAEAVL